MLKAVQYVLKNFNIVNLTLLTRGKSKKLLCQIAELQSSLQRKQEVVLLKIYDKADVKS
jgi:hypothetical protein